MSGGADPLPSVAIDEGSGPGVVLIHGQPGSGQDWRALADELRSDHRVIAPDRPGWGGNPRPAAGLAANAVAIARLLEHCGLEPPLTLVGHSLGGGVALELALSFPDMVGSIVLVGSVGVDAALSHVDRLLALPMVGDGIVRAGTAAVRRSFHTARRLPPESRVAAAVDRAARIPSVRTVIEFGGEPMTGRARASFLVEQRALIEETPSLQRRLPLIRVPVAVVNGTSDRIVPLQAARRLAETIPGAELIMLRKEGHLVALERPELVAPTIRRYARLGQSV
jgi:pimeloyl-ACP methyl ester carboxylesterase